MDSCRGRTKVAGILKVTMAVRVVTPLDSLQTGQGRVDFWLLESEPQQNLNEMWCIIMGQEVCARGEVQPFMFQCSW